MHDNGEIRVAVTVIRQDGAVLGDVLARESFDFGTDEDAARSYAARIARWLEQLPSADFDPDVFVRRQRHSDELLEILDRPWRFEQP